MTIYWHLNFGSVEAEHASFMLEDFKPTYRCQICETNNRECSFNGWGRGCDACEERYEGHCLFRFNYGWQDFMTRAEFAENSTPRYFQLSSLFSTFIQVSLHGYVELIAVTSEIYMGYQNVVSKIHQTHPDANDHTANVTKLLAMCSEMQGHRKRARLAAEKASLVAMEKNREEKDLAKEAAREEKRPRKKPKKNSPPEVPTSDEEDDSVPDEDVPMEDVDSQERRSSPEVQIVDDPIDFDKGAQVVVSGGKLVPRAGHEKAIHTIVHKVVEDNKVVEDKKLSKAAKKEKKRAEVILFPYIHLNRIDRTSAAYVQAMNIVAQTAPEEAAKVASITTPPSLKRGRANDYIDWECGRFYYAQIKHPTPGSNQVPDRAARAIQGAVGVDIPNKGLLRAEYETRSNIVAVIARLSADLGIHETLVAKHNEMATLIRARGLTALTDLPEEK
ncbi:hypothetical protein C8R47DRAFT_1227996 [Mycena vitilis]|nr:hypothetical protein C8R47DRAFT_1227996 [Mycena vitilis]